MADIHVSTSAHSTPINQPPAKESIEADKSYTVNDLWMSELVDELACLGLCGTHEGETDQNDELGRLSLTSDIEDQREMAARTHHDELGL